MLWLLLIVGFVVVAYRARRTRRVADLAARAGRTSIVCEVCGHAPRGHHACLGCGWVPPVAAERSPELVQHLHALALLHAAADRARDARAMERGGHQPTQVRPAPPEVVHAARQALSEAADALGVGLTKRLDEMSPADLVYAAADLRDPAMDRAFALSGQVRGQRAAVLTGARLERAPSNLGVP